MCLFLAQCYRLQDGYPFVNLLGVGNCLANRCAPNCCCAYRQELIPGDAPMSGCPCAGLKLNRKEPEGCVTAGPLQGLKILL